MAADHGPGAGDRHRGQVGDAPRRSRPTTAGCDRVVVGGQPDVVVPRQPHRWPASRPPAGPAAAPSIAARSAAHRSVGRAPDAGGECRALARSSQPPSWALKSAGAGERAPGQERGLQVAVGALDQPLGLRVARPALMHPRSRGCRGRPRTARSASGLPAPPGPDRALVVPHQLPRAPHPARRSSCQCPAIRSGACRDGIIRAPPHPRVAAWPSPAPAARRLPDTQRDCRPAGTTGRTAPARPASYVGARGRVRRQVARPQLAHPVLQHRQTSAASRSARAITVAGIVGQLAQQLPDRRLDRVHAPNPSPAASTSAAHHCASARRTAFRDIPACARSP